MLIAFVALAAGRRLPETLAIVVAWFAGYSLTWASKWAIAVAAGVSWWDIFDVITYRLNGDAPGHVRHHFLAPTRKVLNYLDHETRSAMFFLLLLPTLLLPVRRPNLKRFALLSSPLLIPFGWFELLQSHPDPHLDGVSNRRNLHRDPDRGRDHRIARRAGGCERRATKKRGVIPALSIQSRCGRAYSPTAVRWSCFSTMRADLPRRLRR